MNDCLTIARILLALARARCIACVNMTDTDRLSVVTVTVSQLYREINRRWTWNYIRFRKVRAYGLGKMTLLIILDHNARRTEGDNGWVKENRHHPSPNPNEDEEQDFLEFTQI